MTSSHYRRTSITTGTLVIITDLNFMVRPSSSIQATSVTSNQNKLCKVNFLHKGKMKAYTNAGGPKGCWKARPETLEKSKKKWKNTLKQSLSSPN
jgi:hypothetical protein